MMKNANNGLDECSLLLLPFCSVGWIFYLFHGAQLEKKPVPQVSFSFIFPIEFLNKSFGLQKDQM